MTWCAPPDLARPEWALNETVVEGTGGSLAASSPTARSSASDSTARPSVGRSPCPPDDQVYVEGYRATQAHFIDGPSQRHRARDAGPDTLKTMDVVWAAYRSAEEGRTQTL